MGIDTDKDFDFWEYLDDLSLSGETESDGDDMKDNNDQDSFQTGGITIYPDLSNVTNRCVISADSMQSSQIMFGDTEVHSIADDIFNLQRDYEEIREILSCALTQIQELQSNNTKYDGLISNLRHDTDLLIERVL